MEVTLATRPGTPFRPGRNRAYQTTYQREFSALKRSNTMDEGIPAGQRFPIGAPHALNEPIGETAYSEDFSAPVNVQRGPILRPSTSRANRPHPHPQFTHWPRRPETAHPQINGETKQALRNQLYSTYQVDFIGAPQGFPLPLAYNRSHSFWRHRGHYTFDSEYRNAYRNAIRATENPAGRYGHTSRVPADAIIPLTLPMWRRGLPQTTYVRDISEKAPSQLYMRDFVDSFHGPMDQ